MLVRDCTSTATGFCGFPGVDAELRIAWQWRSLKKRRGANDYSLPFSVTSFLFLQLRQEDHIKTKTCSFLWF